MEGALHLARSGHVHIGNKSLPVHSPSIAYNSIAVYRKGKITLSSSSGTHATYSIQPNITKIATAGELTPPA